MLFRPTVRLSQDTTRHQIDGILTSIRDLLTESEMVESSTAQTRFVGFGDLSLNIELIAYIKTREFNVYLEMQEQLCLSILDIIDEAGARLARDHTLFAVGEK